MSGQSALLSLLALVASVNKNSECLLGLYQTLW